MSFHPTFERIAIQKGIEQGMWLGESAVLLRLLKHKFKTIPDHYYEKISRANSETLLLWAEHTLDCQRLEDIFKS